jgi:hypothetical protein
MIWKVGDWARYSVRGSGSGVGDVGVVVNVDENQWRTVDLAFYVPQRSKRRFDVWSVRPEHLDPYAPTEQELAEWMLHELSR